MSEHLSGVSDDELALWAEKRADDAGRLARELISYRHSKIHGPYGWLNGCRSLREDSWTLCADPIEGSEEHFSIPLYSLSEPFSVAGQRAALSEERAGE